MWSRDSLFSKHRDSGGMLSCTGRWLHNFKFFTDLSFMSVTKQQQKYCLWPSRLGWIMHVCVPAYIVSSSWMYSSTMVALVAVGGESTSFQQIAQYQACDVWASSWGTKLAWPMRFKLDSSAKCTECKCKEGRTCTLHLLVAPLLNASSTM